MTESAGRTERLSDESLDDLIVGLSMPGSHIWSKAIMAGLIELQSIRSAVSPTSGTEQECASSIERELTLWQTASDLCEEIRANGTHQSWKALAYALDAIEESDDAVK